jgi:hypothetical protein
MERRNSSPPEQPPNHTPPERNRLEVIRFPTADAQRQAIRVLLDRGTLNFTSYRDEEWLVQTSVARALRERGISFEWLTEHT